MNICDHCDQPATWVNLTQFAGKHLICNQHWLLLPKDQRAAYGPITQPCGNPYCECEPGCCNEPARIHPHDYHALKQAADLHSDKGYYEATQAEYDKFTQSRNQSIKELSIAAYATLNRYDLTQTLLDKLQEEAAEVIQAVSKIRRFGANNHHPDRTTTNIQELTAELEDFQAIVLALEHLQYLDPQPRPAATARKMLELLGE